MVVDSNPEVAPTTQKVLLGRRRGGGGGDQLSFGYLLFVDLGSLLLAPSLVSGIMPPAHYRWVDNKENMKIFNFEKEGEGSVESVLSVFLLSLLKFLKSPSKLSAIFLASLRTI
ncbi:hypothetical protein MRX96_052468 [Rhipicephalus microplus]